MIGRVSVWAMVLGLVVSFASAALAADLVIDQPWARATIGQTPNGVAYLTVTNNSSVGDRLVAVHTPVAKHASLHTSIMTDGMMRMEAVSGVDLAVGETVRFIPGGLHVMMMGLYQPLREGASIVLTLTFAQAGKIEVLVPVLALASMEPERAKESGDIKKMH